MPKKYIDIYDQLLKNSKQNGECLESTYKVHRLRKCAFFTHKNKLLSVPREAYRWYHGDIPEGMYVCHHCDNPRCFKESHLFLGTARDNMQDMINKKRDNNWGARKYSFQQLKKIKELRNLGHTYPEIGEIMGVNPNGVSAYCNRHGIKRGERIVNKRKFPTSLIKEILQYMGNGLTDVEIYKKMGMSESTFYRILKETEDATIAIK